MNDHRIEAPERRSPSVGLFWVLFAMSAVGSLTVSTPVAGDDVYLKNGSSFEDVMTERAGDQILIRLPYGELRIGWDRVARLELSTTPMEEYLSRRRLLGQNQADAEAWLELALWAQKRELWHRFEEAIVVAADLDPQLDGLAPRMRRLGYTLDSDFGQWVTESDLMRRRGLVSDQGEWITPVELSARLDERQRAARERIAAEREERLSRVVELLALSQLETQRTQAETPEPAAAPASPSGYYPPGVFYAPVIYGRRTGFAPGPQLDALLERVPGSILPLGYGRP